MKFTPPHIAAFLRALASNLSTTDNSSLDYGDRDWGGQGNLDMAYAFLRASEMDQLIPLTAVLAVIFLVGTVGNALVIAVFARSLVKQASNHLMVSLALVDLVTCMVVIPGVLVKEWYYPFHWDILCKLWELINMATIPVSALLLAAIAFDRYLLVCGPPTLPQPPVWPRLAIGGSLAIGVALGLPPMLSVGVYQLNGEGKGTRYLGLCEPNFLLLSKHWLSVYWQAITALFCILLVIIANMYAAIFIKVFRHQRRMAHSWRVKVHPTTLPKTARKQRGVQELQGAQRAPNAATRQHRLRPPLPTLLEGDEVANMSPQCAVFATQAQGMHGSTVFCSARARAKKHLVCKATDSSQENSSYELQGSDSAENTSSTSNCSSSTGADPTSDHTETQLAATSVPVIQGAQHRRAHVKTARVLVLVTVVYVAAFSPAFLMTHGLVSQSTVAFYLYLLHSAANPLLYAFMNRTFRQALTRVCSQR